MQYDEKVFSTICKVLEVIQLVSIKDIYSSTRFYFSKINVLLDIMTYSIVNILNLFPDKKFPSFLK